LKSLVSFKKLPIASTSGSDLNLSNGLLQEVEGVSHVLTNLLINKKVRFLRRL